MMAEDTPPAVSLRAAELFILHHLGAPKSPTAHAIEQATLESGGMVLTLEQRETVAATLFQMLQGAAGKQPLTIDVEPDCSTPEAPPVDLEPPGDE